MLQSLSRFATSLVLLSSPLFAQSVCYSENDGNNFNDLVSMGGPNLLLAVQFTPSTSVAVDRIEVFTGEGVGTNSLSIWTHDAGNNQPGTQIGSAGTWSMTNPNSWQGANLGSPAAVTNGTTYWVVWGCINGSQCSVDVPMATLGQPYRASFDGGQSWSGPFQFNDRHWKFRLYGNCAGSPVTPFCLGDGSGSACPCGNNGALGNGCPNSDHPNGANMSAVGIASLGADTLQLSSTGHHASSLALFMQGTDTGSFFVYGDGLRCIGTPLKRVFQMLPATASTLTAPSASSTPPSPATISGQSAALGDVLTPGATRGYQMLYRDPVNFCTGNTFNATNGMLVVWAP